MKKLLLIVALTAFALPASAADPLPRATPESVGLSPERLARIGALVDTEVREGRMPGAVVAIARTLRGQANWTRYSAGISGSRLRARAC